MPLIQPKIVALDSSHFADAARDFTSEDEAKRSSANRFLSSLEMNGFVPLICFSHLEEVLRHQNEVVVQNVLTFIASIRLLAWVSGYQYPRVMGSVADILAFEASAAFDKPNASVLEVRDQTAPSLFKLGSGTEAVAPFLEQWAIFREWLLSREKRNMEIVAISTSNFTALSKVKIREFLPGRVRSSGDIQCQLAKLEAALTANIQSRGDRRITNADQIAREFLLGVAEAGRHVPRDSPNPVAQLLYMQGIDLAELDPEATFEDVGDIATFRRKLSLVNETLQLPWHSLKSIVDELRVPSGVLQAGIRRFGQDLHERKGSELGDAYLACLAPYADVTLVDKRTLENIERARRKQPHFGALVRKAIRVGNYANIPDQLKQLFQ